MPPADFRRLPAVHILLGQPPLVESLKLNGREATLRAARAALAETRTAIAAGHRPEIDPDSLARRAAAILDSDRPTLRPVINASGILLHTGLGRSPLASGAIEAVGRVARGYCNLEFDLDSGERGRRTTGVAELLRRLTGAEAATVVNNNAAATILALRALAVGREVVVSRGQLVEIGGGFRLPEIFEVSGVRLREVGTTNKTRIADYERAINSDTAALLRVHTSNYRIVGFTEEVGIAELAALGKSRGVFTIDDVGSGALGPDRPPLVSDEPRVADSLAAGADLVLFSGDKLLGGPQCGILVGSKDAIGRVAADPLMRAVRVDKMTLAALEATLRLALDPALGGSRIPLWSFLNASLDSLRARADRLAEVFRSDLKLNATVIETTAYLGGGSVPVDPIPTAVVRAAPPYPGAIASESEFARALRLGDPPVVTRVQGGAVLFDLRAVPEDDDANLRAAVAQIASPQLIPEPRSPDASLPR